MKKKATIAVVALALVLCFAIGGTLAWLVDKTDKVVNTFTYGDINIDLWENDYNPENGILDTSKKVTSESDYKMVPGNSMPKNPTVTVEADSEACWLFVKVDESSNFDTFMTYAIAEGWTQLTVDAEGNAITDLIYYRKVDATTADTDFTVLENNQVSVKEDVTKEMLNADDFVAPTLTFTAYAVQRDSNITTAAQAWTIAQGN